MENAKRIVQVLPALDMSGPAFAALNTIPELLSSGRAVLIIAKDGGEREDMFRSLGCDVEIFPNLGVPVLGRKATETIRNFNPDIIHSLAAQTAVAAYKVSKKLSKPLLTTVNRMGNDYVEDLQKIPDIKLIALSAAIQEKLINRDGFKRESVSILPNGLNLKYFPIMEKSDIIESKRLPVVGTYGMLLETKGQRDFVKAGALVIEKGVDAEFLIMGHGPDKPALRSLADELHITKLLTFSASTITDSRNLGNLDIFVEPTKQEGFGMSVLQAMATGVPVIACGVGGIFSLIEDGVDGLLVPAGDNEAMAEAICTLLQKPLFREELAHNAREKVEKEFNSKVVAQKLLEYYTQVMNEFVV